MMDKKILNALKETITKLETNQNIGDKVTAGRVNPTPQFTWKPKIIVKPTKDEEK